MAFELRKIRTSNKPSAENTTTVTAKAVVILGEKPDYTRVNLEVVEVITAAAARGAKGSLIPGTEKVALRKLMDFALEERRKFDAAAKK